MKQQIAYYQRQTKYGLKISRSKQIANSSTCSTCVYHVFSQKKSSDFFNERNKQNRLVKVFLFFIFYFKENGLFVDFKYFFYWFSAQSFYRNSRKIGCAPKLSAKKSFFAIPFILVRSFFSRFFFSLSKYTFHCRFAQYINSNPLKYWLLFH